MTSVHGRCAYPCRGAYGASKYALEGFSDALRLEIKKFGVTVSILEPGRFGHATCIHSGAQVRTEPLTYSYLDTVKNETHTCNLLHGKFQDHQSAGSEKRLLKVFPILYMGMAAFLLM